MQPVISSKLPCKPEILAAQLSNLNQNQKKGEYHKNTCGPRSLNRIESPLLRPYSDRRLPLSSTWPLDAAAPLVPPFPDASNGSVKRCLEGYMDRLAAWKRFFRSSTVACMRCALIIMSRRKLVSG